MKSRKAKNCIRLVYSLLIICSLIGWNCRDGMVIKAESKVPKSSLKFEKINREKGMELGAENAFLKLYFDHETGGFIVEDKESGQFFYTTPKEAMGDSKASEITKNQLNSPVQLTYYVIDKQQEESMDSYANAILLDQVSWAKIEDGVSVSMTIGREEQRRLLPEQMSRQTFEEITSKIDSERKVKQMKAFYMLYTLDGADESEQKELIAKYPILQETDIYVLKTSSTDRDKGLLEEYIKSTGYTFEQLEEEYERLGYEASEHAFPSFQLTMDYKLEGKSVEVKLDVDAIQYDKSKFLLTNISLFNYLGAGMTGEEGYVFLPDGSGTLISFNNDGTKTTFLTKGRTYGIDGAEASSKRGSLKNEFRFPVFGVKTGESAVFGVIEEGDAISEINCEMGNINHSYNTAYANFIIRRNDSYIEKGAFEQTPWIMYDKEGYSGEIALKYYFLTGEQADYVGMAKTYQNYLVEEQILQPIDTEENLPFMLETIGAVKNPVKKLGIPFVTDVAVTSFEGAYKMIEELYELGIDPIKLRYKAWYNGGYYYSAASKMNVVKVLGGEKGLEQLNKKAIELGAQIYPDVDFLYHEVDKPFDGFKSSKDNVRNLFQKLGFYPEMIPTTLEVEDRYFCVNPNVIPQYYNNFTKSYDKLGIKNISLSTFGKGINSNYKNNEYVSRQTSKGILEDVLTKAGNQYQSIISDYGNAYTLGKVDYILNLPDEDSSFMIADEAVPFAQIALHGYKQYSSTPINLSSEVRKEVLKCIEYGEIPYFLLNYGESSILKAGNIFDAVYSTYFEDWKEEAVNIYFEVNEVLAKLQNVPIIEHKQVQEGVYMTIYENGETIGVNYTEQVVEVEGIQIQPENYVLISSKGGNQ